MNDDFFEKLWAEIEERQNSINKQLSESERKYFQRLEESKRIIENSERKFFKQIELKNTAIKDLDGKINKQLAESRQRAGNVLSEEEEKQEKKSKQKRRKKESSDIIIEFTFSAEQKQSKEIFINHIYRLKTILQEAGYKIADQYDNVIRFTAE